MAGRNRLALAVLGIAVSVVFSYLAIRDVDFDVFWAGLKESNYWWLAPALAVLGLSVVAKALRWRLLFPLATRPPQGATTRALLVGYFFNNILPARAGEALRVVALHQEAGTSRAEALATAISERVYDILALLVLLFVAVPFLPEVTWLWSAGALALVLAVGMLAAFFVLGRWGDRPLRFVLRPFVLLPGIDDERVGHAARNITSGLSGLHRPSLGLRAFAVTVAAWLILAGSYWLTMLAFDLGTGFDAALLAVVTTNLAMIIPSSPAAVGVFEAAVLVALRPYGVDHSSALAYAVVLHAVNFIPYVVTGLYLVHRQALGLGRQAGLAL